MPHSGKADKNDSDKLPSTNLSHFTSLSRDNPSQGPVDVPEKTNDVGSMFSQGEGKADGVNFRSGSTLEGGVAITSPHMPDCTYHP
jgi:hypothetical protein